MLDRSLGRGLRLPAPPLPPIPEQHLTAEAAITPVQEMRVEPLVREGDLVAQGQPVLRLRDAPAVQLVAPMAGRVAQIELRPGRRLSQMAFFAEGQGRHQFTQEPPRILMQAAGLWPMLRSRPFGRMPRVDEVPAAIFVMLADTRPGAADPALALQGREDDLFHGLQALRDIAPVWQVGGSAANGVRHIRTGALHPQGLAGWQIHRHHPATIDAPVWDIHAEDVADLGTLLRSGHLPETRLVSVTGDGLRAPLLLRCQPGADLRGLVHGHVKPGQHRLVSGSMLDGRVQNWLAPRDRQVTVLAGAATEPARHWFQTALHRAARPLPLIPTAALDQAMGDVPGIVLLRALLSGDQEQLVRLGGLSLLEEDLALADYITRAEPSLTAQLRILLDRIHAEEVPA